MLKNIDIKLTYRILALVAGKASDDESKTRNIQVFTARQGTRIIPQVHVKLQTGMSDIALRSVHTTC
jgi:hypothetical protein